MSLVAEPAHLNDRAVWNMDFPADDAQEASRRHREERSRTGVFEGMVGTSPGMREVRSSICKVAPTDSTVLITGETGSGKELVARAIHRRSQRASRPFVSVNCGAVPASLIASELFGHEKGAFTGATDRRAGRFEVAEGGTLFLDEVSELPIDTQVALLRVLQEREFERVGGTRSIRTNVRVMAATNRDLQQAVAERSFRADLFYRLHVFPLEVPPLRDRRQDIPLLAEHFAHQLSERAGKRLPASTPDARALAVVRLAGQHPRVAERDRARGDHGRNGNAVSRCALACGGFHASRRRRRRHRAPLAHEKVVIEGVLAQTKGRVRDRSARPRSLASFLDARVEDQGAGH